jgi:hypothetical protein
MMLHPLRFAGHAIAIAGCAMAAVAVTACVFAALAVTSAAHAVTGLTHAPPGLASTVTQSRGDNLSTLEQRALSDPALRSEAEAVLSAHGGDPHAELEQVARQLLSIF